MRILNFNLYCEARLADILNIKGDSELAKELQKVKELEFDLNSKLPTSIILKNQSILKLKWYDTATHDLVKKIKERTSFASIEHFIEYLQNKLTEVFPYKLGKELFKTGKYSIYLKEYNISIIIGFDLNKNMNDSYFINIVTILPGRKGNNIVRFIDI